MLFTITSTNCGIIKGACSFDTPRLDLCLRLDIIDQALCLVATFLSNLDFLQPIDTNFLGFEVEANQSGLSLKSNLDYTGLERMAAIAKHYARFELIVL